MEDLAQNYARLTLLVQRILDTDVLTESDGEALQAEALAACRSNRSGDTAAARRHVERAALVTEALVQSHRLDASQARVVLETIDRLLRAPGSAVDGPHSPRSNP